MLQMLKIGMCTVATNLQKDRPGMKTQDIGEMKNGVKKRFNCNPGAFLEKTILLN